MYGFTLKIGSEEFKSGRGMEVLGVTFDSKFTWTNQVDNVIKKAKKSNS